MLRRSVPASKPTLCAASAPGAPPDFACPGPCRADIPELCAAIAARKAVRFLYEGTFRVVEPHYYGVTTRGEQVLRAYQTSTSGPALDRGWLTFKVDGIVGMMETENVFPRPRRHYDPDGRGMQGHFAKV